MASYCSLSSDRSLTKCLIQTSNSSFKSFHRFAHKPEWADGLDLWSANELIQKKQIYQQYGHFHGDIGLYLPRDEKSNYAPMLSKSDIIYSKVTRNSLFPERLRQLFEKEKDLLSDNNSNISSSDDQQLFPSENVLSEISSKTIREQDSVEITSNKVRVPLRQIASNKNCSEVRQIDQQTYQSLNQEKLQTILKEHLTSLFSRGATTTFNSKRTVIRIPSVEIKHENLPPKTVPTVPVSTDPTLIMERYAKLQQLLISTSPCQSRINSRLNDSRKSPFVFHGISKFGLTVTPLDYSNTKQFQSSSLETIAQQENNSTITRPSTQPVLFRSSTNLNEEQQRFAFKHHFPTGYISSSGDFITSNNNSVDEQTQIVRKSPRHYRLPTKTSIQKKQTLQLLPPVVSGKRLHIPLSNNRHS